MIQKILVPIKKRLFLLMTAAVLGMLIYYTLHHITLVVTDSVKYRVLWSTLPDKKKFVKNRYLRLTTDKIKGHYNCSDTCSIVKRVGCPAGSFLERRGSDFYCDNVKICKGLTDKKLFSFKGIVPDGKYFMIGDHPKSYDSRAVGFFDEEEIMAVLLPVF